MKIGDHEILLSGIVGSTAYGLAGPDSDVDRLGIFVAPTSAFHGLQFPNETHVNIGALPSGSLGVTGDMTIHEARKYCKLALACNPTILELVWLPMHFIELANVWGMELRDIRNCFPTAKGVRNAYLGYATQQFKRLENRGDGSFSSDTRKRTAKHARHLYRLCYQGYMLYAGGKLEIELPEFMVHRIRAFGERVADGDVNTAKKMLAEYEQSFDMTRSPLGDRPDTERVERWLRAVRHAYWKEAEDVEEIQRRSATHHAELLARGSRDGRATNR